MCERFSGERKFDLTYEYMSFGLYADEIISLYRNKSHHTLFGKWVLLEKIYHLLNLSILYIY